MSALLAALDMTGFITGEKRRELSDTAVIVVTGGNALLFIAGDNVPAPKGFSPAGSPHPVLASEHISCFEPEEPLVTTEETLAHGWSHNLLDRAAELFMATQAT